MMIMLTKDSTFEINVSQNSSIHQVDFDNIAFGKVFSDHLFVMDYVDGEWKRGSIEPFAPLSLSPSTMALHYGQAVFEGMKAYRQPDGSVSMFRPGENIARFNRSAKRICMPEVPEDIFMQALVELISLDDAWVPYSSQSSLYIRPFLFATDSHVGVRPSFSYKFIIFTCPVGQYYNKSVKVKVETHYTRASKGGTGAAKSAGNYAAALLPTKLAIDEGYDQLLWTDAQSHKYIEEIGTMNAAFVIDGKMLIPSTSETVLSGITRDSAIILAKDLGIEVESRMISVAELEEAAEKGLLQEAFGLGTAATVSVICKIGFAGGDYDLPDVSTWLVAPQIKSALDSVRLGTGEDKHGWNIPV
jgi:branched-chain amino acid aminotransferase